MGPLTAYFKRLLPDMRDLALNRNGPYICAVNLSFFLKPFKIGLATGYPSQNVTTTA